MRARLSRVKLCTVGMRNVILGNDPDDDRIVSHDAIFYVRDSTSKLSRISAWNNAVFSMIYFLYLLQ